MQVCGLGNTSGIAISNVVFPNGAQLWVKSEQQKSQSFLDFPTVAFLGKPHAVETMRQILQK